LPSAHRRNQFLGCTPPGKRVVIAADTAPNGRGGTLRKTRIVIEGSKIVAIDHLRQTSLRFGLDAGWSLH
jgi:hypothetical protein